MAGDITTFSKRGDSLTLSGEAPAGLTYRPDLDGLRAIAVLGVIAFHFFPELLPGGFVGVDVFFVLSGYLISRIIWDELSRGTFSPIGFYSRRVRRLFPALCVVLLVTWLFGYLVLFCDEFASLGKHMAASAMYVNNLLLWSEGGYFDVKADQKLLLHLWSLSIEEQFYLVWPWLLICLRNRRLPFLLVAGSLLALSVGACIWLTSVDSTAAFYNPLSRAWELLLGGIVGYFGRRGFLLTGYFGAALSPVGILLIFTSMFMFRDGVDFPGYLALFPTIGAAVVVASGQRTWVNRSILSQRILVGIGLISYPIYLWHWVLFCGANLYLDAALSLHLRLALVGFSVVLAWGTFVLVENPIRHSRTPRRWVISLMFWIVFLGALGWWTNLRGGFPSRFSLDRHAPYLTAERQLAEWLGDVRGDRCHLQNGTGLMHAPDCTESQHPRVLLWGDSHAAGLYPGLKKLQASRAFGLTQLTQAACPPVPAVTSKIKIDCNEINQHILDNLGKLSPEVVILHSAFEHQNFTVQGDILESVGSQISHIRTKVPQARIVLVGPMPRWEPSVRRILGDYVAQHGMVPPSRLPLPMNPMMVKLQSLDESLMILSRELGIRYVSPLQIFCEGGLCLNRLSDSVDGIVAFDSAHMNPDASAYFIARIQSIILD